MLQTLSRINIKIPPRHIKHNCDFLENQRQRENFKNRQVRKNTDTLKGTVRLGDNFSMETRKQWNATFKVLGENSCQPRF